jgi:hypothetical protein
MVGYEAGLGIDPAAGTCVVWLANGMVPDYLFRDDIAELIAAEQRGDPLPQLGSETLRGYDGAEAWVGRWHSAEREIEIVYDDEGLALIAGDNRIPLQRYSRRSNFSLTVDAPGWNRFLLQAVRGEAEDDDALGPIVELTHGHACFVRAGEPLPEVPDYPAEWNGYTGSFRSYNPWYPALRIVLRSGVLVLIDSYGEGGELVPEGNGFRVGNEPPNFDWLEFTPVIEGVAQGIRFETGAEYSRFFTE